MRRLIFAAVLAAAVLAPAAAAAATTPSPGVTPFITASKCPRGGVTFCTINNFDYGPEIAWKTGEQPGNYVYTPTAPGGNDQGDPLQIGYGTNQTLDFCYGGGITACSYTPCIGYNNSADDLINQTCNGATWQNWQSENTSHGWLIWSQWFRNAYPNFCYGGFQAVVTTNGPGSQLYLACPQGGVPGSVFGIGQFWAQGSYVGV